MSRRGQIIRRTSQEHRQEFADLIRQAAYGHATWQIWDDLMFMCTAALAQPFQYTQEREDEYLRRIQRYEKNTQELFPRMLAKIVEALEQEGCVDVLGEIYMELGLSNHWKGQFFTPEPICRFMAKVQCMDSTEQIKELGYITVNDPCCGSGALLIAYAHVCIEQNIEYQRDVVFVAQDIDPIVARMCFIQMSLLGMPGCVIIGNSFLNEHKELLYTPSYFMNGFQWRRQKEKQAAFSKE